jgi:hypothetical protein
MNKHNRDWRQAVSPTAERSIGPAFRSSDCATFTKFSGPPLSPENSGVSEWTAEFAGFVLHGLLRTLQHHRRACGGDPFVDQGMQKFDLLWSPDPSCHTTHSNDILG